MALKDGEDLYAVAKDSVNDPIRALDDLAHVVAPKLGNPPSGHGHIGSTFGGIQQDTDPPLGRGGVVGGDEVANRLEIGESSVCPDQVARFA